MLCQRLMLSVSALTFCLLSALHAAEPLPLGSGEEGGVYNALALTLAKLSAANQGPELTARPSAGSVENINAVADGRYALGIAQSDKLAQAVDGRAEWNRHPVATLRALLTLHEETVTLVAADESGIKSLNDLRGKRVNLGAPGSGQNYNARQVLQAAGLHAENDLTALEFGVTDAARELAGGKLDAFFFTAGHPNDLVRKLSEGPRKLRIVALSCPGLSLLPEASPALTLSTLPAKKLYPALANDEQPVPGIAVRAVLFCAASLPDDDAQKLVKAILANPGELKATLPALAGTTAESLAADSGSAPRHPGAEKALQDAGLHKE